MPARRDEAPPPLPASPDESAQLARLMQKKIAQLTKVVYHVNTTNEDHQGELAALKKQHRDELNACVRDAARKVKDIGDLSAGKAESDALKQKLENLIKANTRDKTNAQTKAREAVREATQKAQNAHERELTDLRAVVKDVEDHFRSAQGVFESTVEKLENGSNAKSDSLEKKLRALQTLLDQKEDEFQGRVRTLETDLEVERREAQLKHEQLMAANEQLRKELEDRERAGVAKGKEDAEIEFEARLGRLRAELRGEHEDALARQSKEHSTMLKEAQALAQSNAMEAARLETGLQDATRALETTQDELRLKTKELARLRDDATRQRGSASEELQRALDAQRVLEQANGNLKEDIAAKNAALRDAADANEALQTRYDALARMTDSELTKRDAQLAEKNRAIEALRSERAALRDGHGQSAKDAEATIAKLQQANAGLVKARASAEANLEALKQAAARDAQALQTQLAALQSELKAAKQALRDVQQQTEAQLGVLKDQLAANKARAEEALQAQRKRSAEREHKALKKRKAREEELEKLLREARAQNALENESMQGSRQKLEKDLKDALSRSDQAEAEASRQQQVTQSLKSQVEELRRQLASEGREAKARLEKELQVKEASWAKRLEKDFAELEARLTTDHGVALQQLNAGHIEALARVEAQRIADLAAASEEADRLLHAATARADAAEDALRRATADLEAARAAVATASKDAHALVLKRDATIQELQDTVRDLERTLEDVRAAAAQTQSDLAQRLAAAEASRDEFCTNLECARHETDAQRRAAEEMADAHKRAMAAAEARRKRKLQEAVKRAARVLALEGFLQAAKDAAVKRAERDAQNADRALAKAACAAAKFALELNKTWNGKSDGDRRAFADRFAAMEHARDAALEDGRVALEGQRRRHDDALKALRREADERETAASAYLDSERRRLEEERDELLAKATRAADLRHETMVDAFESARKRTEGLLRDAEARYEELDSRYQNRPSRPEDVEKIETLERENEQALRDVARMKEELVYFKRELINREENFNQRFATGGALGGANPTVGVMNVLTKKNRMKKPKRGF